MKNQSIPKMDFIRYHNIKPQIWQSICYYAFYKLNLFSIEILTIFMKSVILVVFNVHKKYIYLFQKLNLNGLRNDGKPSRRTQGTHHEQSNSDHCC